MMGVMSTSVLDTAAALAVIEDALDRLEPSRPGLDPEQRLRLARAARRLAGRTEAVAAVLLAEADRAQASLRTTGTPTSSWLAVGENLSRRESAGALFRAQRLAEHPKVGQAASDGRINTSQARAIGTVLDSLAPQLDEPQRQHAEELMLELAGNLDSDRLAKAAPRVLRTVAPQQADELLDTRLQRETEAAHRNRSLVFTPDRGSMRFSGSLPRAEAEAWLVQLDAYVESRRRNLHEERDPLATSRTPEQRRADALIDMIRGHQATKRAPTSGGDRPVVIVKLDYDRLRAGAAGAGLIGDEPISAGDLRRLCCDAGLLPAVLGGASEVLDVGRTHRTVPPKLRTALILRDGGCVFPRCQARPAACDAHHIDPWYLGGPTALGNLVLLCHHHHALVEPARYGVRDQWLIRLGTDGVPEAIPPSRIDPARRPIRDSRFPAAHDPPNVQARQRPATDRPTGNRGTGNPPAQGQPAQGQPAQRQPPGEQAAS